MWFYTGKGHFKGCTTAWCSGALRFPRSPCPKPHTRALSNVRAAGSYDHTDTPCLLPGLQERCWCVLLLGWRCTTPLPNQTSIHDFFSHNPVPKRHGPFPSRHVEFSYTEAVSEIVQLVKWSSSCLFFFPLAGDRQLPWVLCHEQPLL